MESPQPTTKQQTTAREEPEKKKQEWSDMQEWIKNLSSEMIRLFVWWPGGQSQKKKQAVKFVVKSGEHLVWPPPCNTDHQDDITCLGSGIPINLHFPLLQGGGHVTCHCLFQFWVLARKRHA